jgi:hypothetical protein
LKEDEDIRCAVMVEVDDGARTGAARRIKILNKIYLIVEIPIRFTADDDAFVVVLANIGLTIEVRVANYFGDAVVDIVDTPDVRSSIVV